MRRVYNYQCSTCGLEVEVIWNSTIQATDEEMPMYMPCKRLNCQGFLNRAKPVRIGPTVVGQGFINHDGQLVMMINPDTLTPEQKQRLDPANPVINLKPL